MPNPCVLPSIALLTGLIFPEIARAGIPLAMRLFGTVIPGVGTLHAVGGLAATLQRISTMRRWFLQNGVGIAGITEIAKNVHYAYRCHQRGYHVRLNEEICRYVCVNHLGMEVQI